VSEYFSRLSGFNLCRPVCLFLCALLQLTAAHTAEPGLIEAVKSDNNEKALLIISQSDDVNIVDIDGATPLHWAVRRDNLVVLDQLLQAGADPDRANPYRVTPLWLACTNRNTTIIERLLAAGADPNAVLVSNESVLMNCVRTGAVSAVEPLIRQGAEVNWRESDKGQTALMWSAASGYPEITRILIDHGADITARSKNGFTPLLFAASSGDIESVRMLLQAGANINESTPEHGNALLVAAASGHNALSLFLIDSGADINVEDPYGVTPLHHAIRGGLSLMDGVIYDAAYRTRPQSSIELATRLLEAGADPDRQIKKNRMLGPDGTPFFMEGASPFLLAAASADVPMMKLLIKHGADMLKPTTEHITPLMAATQSACTGTCAFQEGGNIASKQDIEIALTAVKFLIESGADVNHKDKLGRTAMHIAAFTGSAPVVQYLVDQGASVHVKNIYGETPWSMASGMSPSLERTGMYGNHVSTAALLLKLGAKPISSEDLIDPYAPVDVGLGQ